MVNIKLETVQQANELVDIFKSYEEEVDVLRGRYCIDGKSFLGLIELIGSFASVSINTDSIEVKNKFIAEVEAFNKKWQ